MEIVRSHPEDGRADDRGSREASWRGLLAGSAALVPIAVADILLGGSAVFVSAYPLGPIVAAPFAMAPVLILWAASLLLGIVSPIWNENGGQVDYWLRLLELLLAGAFAVVLSGRWAQRGVVSSRLELLDRIGATSDGSLALDETLRQALFGIVPGAADFCMIDTIRDGVVTRVGVRVRGRDDDSAIEETMRRRLPSTPAWLRDPGFGIPPLPYFLPRVTAGHEEILAHDPEDLHFLRSLGLRSVVIAPMIARGRLLGTLTLGVAWSGRRYTEDDLAFTRALSSRLGLALDHAGLFSDLESVERRMDAVMSKIPEAVTVHDASGALVFANDVAAAWIGAPSGKDVIESGGATLRAGLEVFDESGSRLEEADLIGARLRSGDLPFRQLLRAVTAFDQRERWLMVSADAIRGPDGGILYAVTTMEDITEMKRAELGQRLLARIGEVLATSSDHRAALQEVAELAVPVFADWCAVNLLTPDGMIEAVSIALEDPAESSEALAERERHPLFIDDGSRVAQVVEEGKPALYSAAGTRGADEHLSLLRRFGLDAAIAVPIRAGERIVGALSFANRAGGRQFDYGDFAFAGEIGAHAGLAIETARLAELRRDIADTLQEGLLPPELPKIDGWEVAAMYHPAGELNEVGGDFYDAFEVENGWMIVMGDVVGRGAKAAALTALARHTISTACRLTGDPRQALSLLNSRLRESGDRPLCTVAIVVLSSAANEAADAVVISAGHPPPLHLRGSRIDEACKPGPMLGVMEGPEWDLELIELQPGEQLVIYTDGVTEARAEGSFFGEERLRERIAGAADPGEAVAGIESALAEFVEGGLTDDAAALAIMRSPAAPLPPQVESRVAERHSAAG